MELNGHELEMQYVALINDLNRAKKQPRITDALWVNKGKKKLRDRLKRLENDYDNGLIADQAYIIWKRMINEAL